MDFGKKKLTCQKQYPNGLKYGLMMFYLNF